MRDKEKGQQVSVGQRNSCDTEVFLCGIYNTESAFDLLLLQCSCLFSTLDMAQWRWSGLFSIKSVLVKESIVIGNRKLSMSLSSSAWQNLNAFHSPKQTMKTDETNKWLSFGFKSQIKCNFLVFCSEPIAIHVLLSVWYDKILSQIGRSKLGVVIAEEICYHRLWELCSNVHFIFNNVIFGL